MRALGGLLLIGMLLLGGCGQEDAGESRARYADVRTAAEQAEASFEVAEGGAAPAAKDAAAGEEGPAGAPPAAANAVERKIIYVAGVELVVEDFAEVQRRIPELVRRHDGYLAEANVDRTHGAHPGGRWVARIPVARFDAFLDAVVELGVPEQRSQTAQDVTEEYVDLEARIANKRRLEERVLDLLERREGKIEEVIKVEQELSRVREEIERMEGRLRYLQNRTALTTVTITAREERDYVPPQAPSFTGRVTQAWVGSLRSLRQFGEWLVIASVAAAPWLIPALVLLVALRWLWKHSRRVAGPT